MRKIPIITLLLATVVCVPSWSQRAGGRQASNERFEQTAPAVGARMPEVTVFDAEGEPHGLRKLLRGHYTVLVLGCLT